MGNQIGAGSRSLGVFFCASLALSRSLRPRGYNSLVSKRKEPFNFFYVVLLPVGVAFALTAFAYFVMAARARATNIAERSDLMRVLDVHGASILGGELAVLAVCTIGAIAWDHYASRRDLPDERRHGD